MLSTEYKKDIKFLDEKLDDIIGNGIYSEESLDWVRDEIYDLIKDDIQICSGVTKAVVVFYDKDYVIKIPFHAQYIYNEKYQEEYLYNYETNRYDIPNPDYDINYDGMIEFQGAPFSYNDYCYSEVELYKIAKTKYPGAEKFLAESKKVNNLYIQEKAEIIGGFSKEKIYYVNEIMTKYNLSNTKLPNEWIYLLYNYCKNNNLMQEMDNFFSFIIDNEINDLHDSNCGIINGIPVLVDYSGWGD